MTAEILTIGHSGLSYEQFLHLLRQADIEAVADVRSIPYSKRHKVFARETLKARLEADNIAYVFLGDALGGRPRSSALYCDGVADYDKMAQTEDFRRGLARLIKGAEKYRIAVMCAEAKPETCHRCLLVGRELRRLDVAVSHILSDGGTVSQQETEQILRQSGSQMPDLFDAPGDETDAAYRRQRRKAAFSRR